MRRFCSAMAGAVLVLAAVLSGCGGDSGSAPGAGFLDEPGGRSAVPFKSTDTSQFDKMKQQMMESQKSGVFMKKPIPPPKEAKPAEKKP
jgi:hypothetical protein